MNMLKIEKKNILNIQFENDFLVDVFETDKKNIEFWLYHKDYGIKSFMFGIPYEEKHNEKYLLELINNNIKKYIDLYKEEFMEVE